MAAKIYFDNLLLFIKKLLGSIILILTLNGWWYDGLMK